MGAALLGGLLAAGVVEARGVAVVEPSAARRGELAAEFPGVTVTDAPVPADGVVVATKPPDVATALGAAAEAGARRVLSIAAGIGIDALEAAAGRGIPVVRAMPNTPSLVGAGAAAVAPGRHATEGDLQWAESLLGAVGTVVRVPEPALDAVTGLSGSGPAYVFLVAEALIDAGVLAGLAHDTATALGDPDAARRRPLARRERRRPRCAASGGDLAGWHHRGGCRGAGGAGRPRRPHRCGRSGRGAVPRARRLSAHEASRGVPSQRCPRPHHDTTSCATTRSASCRTTATPTSRSGSSSRCCASSARPRR